MPIYEYRCESCAERFEVLTRFAERDTAQICPVCESTKTRVLVSSFAVAAASRQPPTSLAKAAAAVVAAAGAAPAAPDQTSGLIAFPGHVPGQRCRPHRGGRLRPRRAGPNS